MDEQSQLSTPNPRLGGKLWIYTNFDCNLRCSYCVTESSPEAPRCGLGVRAVRRLIDEGAALGFGDVFLTGGEPFLVPDIGEMISYAAERAHATVLTNGMLLNGSRLDGLAAIAGPSLTVQVSLDGARPEHNDGCRGKGTWSKAVRAIKSLQEAGMHVAVSSTETPDNALHLDELRQFVRELGIAEHDHFVRPLAKRGFASEGMEVGRHNLVPEVTVSADGVYWHPLLAPSQTDTRVTADISPLAAAVEAIEAELLSASDAAEDEREEFT